jgi:iron(III) transport system permease protein
VRRAGRHWVDALLIVLAFLVIYPLLMLVRSAQRLNPVVDGSGLPSVKHFSVLGSEKSTSPSSTLAAGGSSTILAVSSGSPF